jgi:hypothetical protein
MAADSAIIVLIDIFRLLVRSGVIAALLSTQTPAASDHSINHEPLAMDQRWPQNSAGKRVLICCAAYVGLWQILLQKSVASFFGR